VDVVNDTAWVAHPAQIPRATLVALHRQMWEPLARSATWLVGSREVGEELAQDAFVRLIEHWPEINNPEAAPAWLYRTVVNLSRSSNRRRAVGREKRQLAISTTPLIDQSATLHGDSLAFGALGVAIGQLPTRQRECIVLRFVHDLSVPQIANALDIGTGSVKTHLHRAISKLQALEGLHDE